MKSFRSVALSLFLSLAPSVALKAQAPAPTTSAMEQRIDGIMAKLSLEEKLAMLGGEDRFYTHAVPAAGVPGFKMSDGPVGVRTFGPSPAYTASVALAASWDTQLAERVGSSLGEDARARGVHFLLAPGVNIYRSPLNGRNMEYLGEDPFLSGQIAVGYIRGIQSRGVAATVKHFAANNSEYDRHRINAIVDERTLRELYLPAFEAAVKEGHVAAVMDGYNLVNGEHATQNAHLNLEILKKEWCFDGLLMSDWDSTYDGLAAAKNGLDLEMPYAKLMTPATLKAGLAAGTLNQSTVDDKVRRLLRTALKFGWLDHEQIDASISLNHPDAAAVALDEARESLTLLKNKGHLLPLDPKKVKTIAVVGPESVKAMVGGGGSSEPTPFAATGVVAGLTSYLGNRLRVMYVSGAPSLSDVFNDSTLQQLHLVISMAGKPDVVTTNADESINRWDGSGRSSRPEHGDETTYLWEGDYVPAATGEYSFLVGSPVQDHFVLELDGKPALDAASDRADNSLFLTVHAIIQQAVHVKLRYTTRAASPQIGLGIQNVAALLSPEGQQVIRDADAVLVAVGFDDKTEGEGFDRPYRMPGFQNELINAVTSLNRRTIVSVTSGSAVETRPWIAKVPALLDTFYAGQEGTRALAEILFGERSPEGHLPWSWETTLEDNPTSAHYSEENSMRDSHYEEGLNVGYRYYTTTKKQPLFAFGHGLSYTSFKYSNLSINVNGPDDVEVALDIENTGKVAGATVAQIYVGDPSAHVARPAKELKQFRKLRLQPGAKEQVTFHLNRRAFQYYDVTKHAWQLDPGQFILYAGESSAQIDLQKTIELR